MTSEAGWPTVTPIGNQRHYQANRHAPAFEELRGLSGGGPPEGSNRQVTYGCVRSFRIAAPDGPIYLQVAR